MAGKFDIGPRIGIEGEREYKQAIAQITQGQKVMASELQLVAARFEGQEKSVEAVTAKHDVLQRTLYGEQEKVQKLREALNNASNSFGESDKRTQKWQIELNKAEANVAKLEHQIDETAESGSGLGDVLGGLTQKFGIQLPGGITQSLNSMMQVNTASVALVGGLAALVTAIVKVEGKLLDLTKAQAAAADELVTTSQKTGIATKALQEYAYAADCGDVSVDTSTAAQTKLIRAMDDARDGTEKNVEAFARLGIEYQNADGTLRDSETVFWKAIDALGRMQSGTERDAAAMDLLGKSAQDLNPLIEAGSARMRELAEEAEAVGYVLSEQDVAALTEMDDAQKRMQKSNEALQKQIAAQFAPHATEAFETLTKVIGNLGDALVKSGVVDAFGYILESAVGLIAPLGKDEGAAKSLATSLRPLAQMLALIADTMSVIAGLANVLAGIGSFDKSRIQSGWTTMTTGLGANSTYASNMQKLEQSYAQQDAAASGDSTYYNGQFYGNSDAALYAQWEAEGMGMSFDLWKQSRGRNAAGTYNWRGGLTWVGEAGPELVGLPSGSQIYTAQESREIAAGETNITLVVPGGVREMAQIVELYKAQRGDSRRGGRVRR